MNLDFIIAVLFIGSIWVLGKFLDSRLNGKD